MEKGTSMENVFQLLGPHQVVQIFGVKLIRQQLESGKS